MTINELEKLAAKGESETVEFKKTTAQLTRAGESLCSACIPPGGAVRVAKFDERLESQLESQLEFLSTKVLAILMEKPLGKATISGKMPFRQGALESDYFQELPLELPPDPHPTTGSEDGYGLDGRMRIYRSAAWESRVASFERSSYRIKWTHYVHFSKGKRQ